MNDPQETLHTLRREIKTLRLSDGNTTAIERSEGEETPVVTAPSVVLIPETPGECLSMLGDMKSDDWDSKCC